MKIWNASKAAGKEVHQFVNDNVELFKNLYKKLDVSYDRFLQTSDEEKHIP
ncbi:class I tRNA ligase family protein [bacterium]|jgi:methionyl-tRNA synthetase|nr:class I tRNA ligase family protein [bacterium]